MGCSQTEVDYTRGAGIIGGQGRTAADVFGYALILSLNGLLGGCLLVAAGLLTTTASVTHSPCAELAGFSPPRHSASYQSGFFPLRKPRGGANQSAASFFWPHLHGVRGLDVSEFRPVGSRRAGAVFFDDSRLHGKPARPMGPRTAL